MLPCNNAATHAMKCNAVGFPLPRPTDGEPTPQIDLDPNIAITLAQKLGIKIYTIGIGGNHGGFIEDPQFGVVNIPMKLNVELLKMIAQKTGGQFF